jgi:hypothetical protein
MDMRFEVSHVPKQRGLPLMPDAPKATCSIQMQEGDDEANDLLIVRNCEFPGRLQWQICMCDDYVSGHFPSTCFLLFKAKVSETVFFLRLQVEPTPSDPLSIASPYLRQQDPYNVDLPVSMLSLITSVN